MDWSSRNRAFGLGAFFFVASSVIRYIALAQTPYANGWDGYYYLMQAHSWLTYDHLQSADFSLIYPYFIVFSYLINNYELAFKIGAAVLSGGLVAASFAFVFKVSKKLHTAVLIGSFLLFSPTVTYMISQFPKNVMGMIILLLFLLALNNKNVKVAALYFLFALFTHRMIAGLCLIGMGLFVTQYLNWKWILGGVAALIIISLLPGIIHISDLQRFEGQFQLMPQLATLSFFRLYKGSISILWAIELGLLSILIVGVVYLLASLKRNPSPLVKSRFFWIFLLLISVFPFFKMNFGSMGYRFFMLAPLLLPIFFLSSVEIKKKWSVALSLLLIGSSAFSFRSYEPKYFDPPNKLYEIIVSRLESEYSSKEYPLVIAHKSLAEMIIYKTDFDALNWSPPENYDDHEILRIVNGVDYIYFSKYLNKDELKHIKKLTLNYYITSESVWSTFLERVNASNDKQLIRIIEAGNNPLEERPYFLRKGKNL